MSSSSSAASRGEHASEPSGPRWRVTRIFRRLMQFSLAALLCAVLIAGIVFQQSESVLREYFRDKSLVVPTNFDLTTGKNILWTAKLGSMAWGRPVVAGGKIFVGTNNAAEYLERFPSDIDLGVLLCFDIKDGTFLWQDSNQKLATGLNDWPFQGVTSAASVEGDRLWYVSNRGEVVCLDTEGFHDGQDDGVADLPPGDLQRASFDRRNEADTVWRFDMIGRLGVFPHNASCSGVAVSSKAIFVNTGNGVNQTHVEIPNPEAPSLLALDKVTGQILWSDNSPGKNVLHGSWGTPTYALVNGQPQVIFPGGDGWLYGFDPAGENGKSKLLWKFDCNPKDSEWLFSMKGTRNNLIAAPTVANDLVYIAVGQDPEHGEGDGRVLCIDPTKRGDVSAELVFNQSDPEKVVPHRRKRATDPKQGDFVRRNPNSALVWQFTQHDFDGDGEIVFEERMHRTTSRVVVKRDLAIVADSAGLIHCLDAKTGQAHWTYDLLATCWSSPILSADHIFVTDEDGAVNVFRMSADPAIAMPGGNPVLQTYLPNSMQATPTIAENVLYLVTRQQLIAIANPPAK